MRYVFTCYAFILPLEKEPKGGENKNEEKKIPKENEK